MFLPLSIEIIKIPCHLTAACANVIAVFKFNSGCNEM